MAAATPDHFVATAPLYVRAGVLAHNVGDHVAAESVEANGWGDLVARPGTAPAKRADAAASGD